MATPHPLPAPTTHFLREAEAAELLCLRPKTLSRWRWAGTGPKFHRFGASVRYSIEELRAYAAAGGRTMSAYLLHWGTLEVSPPSATNTDLEEYCILEEQPERLSDLEPGETFFMDPYPSEPASQAMKRLRSYAGSPPAACVRRDDDQLVFRGLKAGSTGRLGAWTGLIVGQALCWGMCPTPQTIALAIRIAGILERRGAGRYIVFEDESALNLWVRRVG